MITEKEMKKFKVVLTEFLNGETNPEVMDLVNIKDKSDRIMAAPDEFTEGEIVSENGIELKECQYVDDQTFGTCLFAFKK
tara:strand:- start:2849 stop:3088 length:240 start_codon:yes stop_codon:yes gene_type:complete